MTEPVETSPETQSTLRRLAMVWGEFEGRLEAVPILKKLYHGRLTVDDYQLLLLNLRQQVIDGAQWIARAASNVDIEHFELRSRFLEHASTEHRDYQLLENDYVSLGGDREVIRNFPKNPGSEALSAWMFHRASQPNPFDLLGAMFIIEGLGSHKATEWGTMICNQLELPKERATFLLYHGANDDEHMAQFSQSLEEIQPDEALRDKIVMTARVTARLYALQLEDITRDANI